MIRVNTDAAYNPKNKKAGLGIVITGPGFHEQIAIPLETSPNNHTAEFQALIYALNWLVDHDLTSQMVFVACDSKALTQVIHNEGSKNEAYQKYLESILALRENFQLITFDWVPESQNKGADNLAKQALRKAQKDT
ncbi:14.7 kDa ribonuclease H-like protein [Alloiococcus otitis]|uniref:RNase H type-1 domain-containing protein n=1 Tax=Alloiococcus otitis ATCC 51267 TaxID=883081 RepID=K9EBD2_9LACT|nr:ribonuclease HI family protein [Alloiococcus otitis]EKU93968.1 hypothetical protein HMPREF9698_00448 [Alloiococcus otitis ATCC 51267]SUU80947.1 14.7 kDa ribonuclease H-like protein [Alloiococcus otitis]